MPRTAESSTVLPMLADGADLVLHDEGILLTAAALQSMGRRARRRDVETRPDVSVPS